MAKNRPGTIALVDGSRLYFANERWAGGQRQIQYPALMDLLLPNDDDQMVMFSTFVEDNERQAHFLQSMEELGIEVVRVDVKNQLAKSGRFDAKEVQDLIRFDAHIAFRLGQLQAEGYKGTVIVLTDSPPMIDILNEASAAGLKVEHHWLMDFLDRRFENRLKIPTHDLMDHRRKLYSRDDD